MTHCDNPPCEEVGPFRYCPIRGCGWMEESTPKPPAVISGEWVHRKGHRYLVLGLASDSNNTDPHSEAQVVYVSLDAEGRTGLPMHVRSVSEFLQRFAQEQPDG